MKWFALLGMVLFFGVAVAPSINAGVKEQVIIESELVVNKFENLLGLIEGIISYYERSDGPLPDEYCGCDIAEFEWRFPGLCTLILILLIPTVYIWANTGNPIFEDFLFKLIDITFDLDCYFTRYIPDPPQFAQFKVI